MFGRKRRTTTASAISSHPDDNLRLKSTGERVTILSRTSDGAVKVALVDRPYLCEDIVSADDIGPA
ncbi:hypothetical protein ACFXD5_19645 [Streptomyces sp. NPDC059385]|uniref:hypothetical protein n=1 Tax=Streptomyces sp. NPDC059385 TaxID=3346817 RepID=UPI0036C9FCE2